MDQLKSAIADKVLELSSLNGEDIRSRLDKINRFRDFVNACRSLTAKYPEIESELLNMIKNDDFDTKTASLKVDSIIQLADNRPSVNKSKEIGKGVLEPSEMLEECSVLIQDNIDKDKTTITQNNHPTLPLPINDQSTEDSISAFENIEQQYQISEDGDSLENMKNCVDCNNNTEEYKPGNESNTSDASKESLFKSESQIKQRSLFLEENSSDSEQNITTTPDSDYRDPVIVYKSGIKPKSDIKRETIPKILQIPVITIIVLALIFLVVFFIRNWEILLWVGGIIIVCGIIILYFIKSKNKTDDTKDE